MLSKKFLIPFLIFTFWTFSLVQVSYAQKVAPIRILLVPGHDNEVWGAQYGTRKEADMTLAVGMQIYDLLKQDKRFDVYITRDYNGYTKEFADYFNNHQADILTFEQNDKKIMESNIADGAFIQKVNPPHASAKPLVALRLYGFNKWADENKMDAVIHIHFNDYPRSNAGTIGKYTGFTVYMPDGQMLNAQKSLKLATSIFSQLKKKYHTSTYSKELGGLVSDQKLIAIGANGTLDAGVRSVLIEYGYIYEKRFRTSYPMRLKEYTNMANLTATGIKSYFFPTSP